jgi:hypothetical protein
LRCVRRGKAIGYADINYAFIMNPKFLVLYLVFGTLALLIAAYKLITTYPDYSTGRIAIDIVISIFFYYLAYKAYHVKKDQELM